MILAIIIITLISFYLNFGINLWQSMTENMKEIDDGGSAFYPEYITINPFKILDKNK